MVEFRRNILGISDAKAHVIPWVQMSGFLSIFNLIHESHKGKEESMDGLVQKSNYLQAILNNKEEVIKLGFNEQYVRSDGVIDLRNSFKLSVLNWKLKNTDGDEFELIKDNYKDGISHIGGKDGFNMAEALKNRVEVFSALKDSEFKYYEHVIWNTDQKIVNSSAEVKYNFFRKDS